MQQRYLHTPWLVIKKTDGTSQTLHEQLAIDTFLSETFGFTHPSSEAFDRAFFISHYTSLLEFSDRFSALFNLPTKVARQAELDKQLATYVPAHLGAHDKIVAASGGPFYFGEKV